GLLKEAVPSATRVAVMWNANDPAMTLRYEEVERAAGVLHVSVEPLGVRESDDIDKALLTMTGDRPDAVFLVSDALTNVNRKRIIDFAATHHIPAMYEFAYYVQDGGLMSYGPNMDNMFRRAALYVDRIFKGAKPGDLPVELPMTFELIINQKTANSLGLTIPQSLRIDADEVIE